MRRSQQTIRPHDSRFYFSWFPGLQIGLALLFAAASLLGPLLIPELNQLIPIVSGLGLLLGLVTLRIGWRAAIEKRPVNYPFSAWSVRIVGPLAQPGQADQAAPANRPVKNKTKDSPSTSPRLLILGYASLVVGAALVLGILIFCYITFAIG